MARAGYANVVSDSFGNRLAGAAIEVRQPGTSTKLAAPLYKAPTGATTLGNPLTADGQGFFAFYLDTAQTVDLYVAAAGYNALTVAGVGVVVGDPVLDGSQIVAGSITDAQVAAANKDGPAATPSLRTLGVGGQQAAAGDHGHSGVVTSVGLAAPAELTVSGSPVTSAGTLTLAKAPQGANQVYAGPTAGVAAAPGFRGLVAADLPGHASTHNAGGSDALAADAAPGTASPRTLGTGAQQAAAGNHGHTVPAARVYHSAAQSIATGITAFAVLAFNSERFDNDGIHDTATNNSRLTCQTAGKYLIFAAVQWATPATACDTILRLRLNGTTVIASQYARVAAATGPGVTVSTVYDLAAGDYVEVQVAHSDSGALNVTSTGNTSPELGMVRVG